MKKIFLLFGAFMLLSAASVTAQKMPKMPTPAPGETLYVGEAKFENVKKFKIGFLLSANDSVIHQVTLLYSNLKRKNSRIKKGAMTYGSYRFTVDSGKVRFKFGSNTITDLIFMKGGAKAKLNFVLSEYDYSFMSGPIKEIETDFGTSEVVFTIVKGKGYKIE